MNFDLYKDALGQHESTDNYSKVNKYNYLGRYQFGARDLQALGMVKKGTTQAGLNKDSNWLVGNKKEFLSSPEMQDEALRKATERNYSYLTKKGIINDDTSPDEQVKLLTGAHLVGGWGLIKSLRGEDVRDANRMSPDVWGEKVRQSYLEMLPKQASPMPMPEEPSFENFQNMLLGNPLGTTP